jgi:ubiquitin-conjugating enzyme E2 T
MSDLVRVKQRMMRELQQLGTDPPFGVAAYCVEDKWDVLRAELSGFSSDSVYKGGIFSVNVAIPSTYPFEPPKVRFETKVYHPNIDSGGRICLDTLNMPPKGTWSPSVNIGTLLTMLRQLLLSPNPSDGLETEIAAEYVRDRARFDLTARQWTAEHAHGRGDNINDTDTATHTLSSPSSSSSSSSSSSAPVASADAKMSAVPSVASSAPPQDSDSEPEETVIQPLTATASAAAPLYKQSSNPDNSNKRLSQSLQSSSTTKRQKKT